MILFFKDLQEYHFYKDVGQIPVAFSKYLNNGEKVEIIYSNESDINMPYEFEKYIKIKNIKKFGFLFFLYGLFYVALQKERVIMMFHLSKSNMIMSFFLKILIKKVYIKSDLNYFQMDSLSKSLGRPGIKSLAFKILLKIVDVISVEDVDCFNKLVGLIGDKNVLLIPNFIDPEFIKYRDVNNIGVGKKNKFLVVGRPGDPIKNIEFILKIAKNINFKNGLEIHLCGKYTDDFKDKYEKCKSIYKNIFLRGSLGREELAKEYAESIGILLPSLHEGFPLCALEAIWFGCYVIASPVGGMKQITNGGENGKIIDLKDEEDWVRAINEISSVDDFREISRSIAIYGEEKFNSLVEIKKLLKLYE